MSVNYPLSDAARKLYGWDDDPPETPASEAYPPRTEATFVSGLPILFGLLLQTIAIVAATALAVWLFCFVLPEAYRDLAVDHARIATGFSNNSDHGATFQEFAANALDSPYEIWASFRADGTKVAEYCSNEETQVRVPNSAYVFSDLCDANYYVHTHPIDCPFSPQDIVNAGSVNAVATIVVTESHTYYLLPRSSGWPTVKTIKALVEYAEQNNPQLYFEPIYQRDDGGWDSASTDQLIELIAEECDLAYYKINGHTWFSARDFRLAA